MECVELASVFRMGRAVRARMCLAPNLRKNIIPVSPRNAHTALVLLTMHGRHSRPKDQLVRKVNQCRTVVQDRTNKKEEKRNMTTVKCEYQSFFPRSFDVITTNKREGKPYRNFSDRGPANDGAQRSGEGQPPRKPRTFSS